MRNNNGTAFEFVGGKAAPASGVLVVPLVAKPRPPMQLVSAVDVVCDDAVSELLDICSLSEEPGQRTHTTTTAACKRVLVVSLGEREKLDVNKLRKAAGGAARWLIAERITRATLWVDGLAASGVEQATAEWAGAMVRAGFRFAEHKEPDEKVPAKVRVHVRSSESGHVDRALPQIRAAVMLADAINYTRRLAHEPANVINPTSLAAEARKLATQARLKCTVLDGPQLKRLGMNGLLAVGSGAKHGPCLIRLDYRGARNARTTTVLVGKAVTFDTGGYSIKPSQGLEGLKYDKCGGVTVLGILKAAAALKLKCNLVGIIAAAENAISERAYRPGDILKLMSGKTVEVISTDAEGRLILADALWYAQQKCKPTALIDLATLTGGANAALGKAAAALMANDDNLADELEECGRRTYERLWRLPLWDEYRELITGGDADIKNSAGKREAHCIVGGMFLKEFVKDEVPWAHIDIAAVATCENGNHVQGKGATGFGVRLLVEYLQRRMS